MRVLFFKRMGSIIVFFFGVLLWSANHFGTAHAQTYQPYANLFENHSFSKEGKTLPYRLMKPKGFDASKRYPLHIALHGAPERGTNNEQQVSTTSLCVAPWAVDSERTVRPAFVLAPQCPPDQEWVALHWSDCGAKLPPAASMAWPGRFVLDLIDSLCREFPSIDTTRIYLSGGSMGGVGTWYLCQYRPDRFAAAFPVTGAGDTTLPMSFVNNIPVWTFAGSLDDVVPVSATRSMIAAIRRAGGDPHYNEITGEGHTNALIGGAAANPEVHAWLFSQTKRSTTVEFHTIPSNRHVDKSAVFVSIAGFRNASGSISGVTRINDLMGRIILPNESRGRQQGRSRTAILVNIKNVPKQ